MPILDNISVALMSDIEFVQRGETVLKWCLLPRRCYATGKWMLFTMAYRVRNIWTGPGTQVVEDRWYERTEMLVLKLKGN